jgi:DNA-directed RNA polymerase specialized sigma24 family protein
MNKDDHLLRNFEEQLEGLGANEHLRLTKHTENCLERYCMGEKPRLGETAKRYVNCAKVKLRADAAAWIERHPGKTVVELLELTIEKLLEQKEAVTRQLVDEISDEVRAETWKRVTAWAMDKYGGREVAGTSVEDHISDAYLQARLRERHLPPCREVSLVAFLIESVHSNVDHLLKKDAALPRRVSIVAARTDQRESGTCSAEELPVDDSAGEERAVMEKAERFFRSIKDPELQRYARFRATGEHYSAKECAEALGLSVPKVRSLHRRLLRLRKKWDLPESEEPARLEIFGVTANSVSFVGRHRHEGVQCHE